MDKVTYLQFNGKDFTDFITFVKSMNSRDKTKYARVAVLNVENGKLVRLDNTNIKSYIGKLVHFRSVLFCQNEKLCNKCAGDLYYNLDIQNVGLTVTRVGSAVLNLSLKNFHDTTLHLKRINYKDYID